MPRDITRGWLRAAERAQTLMRSVTDQCLEPPANGLGVGRRSTGELGLREQVIVDVHGLLHLDHYAVSRWQKQPYLDGFDLHANITVAADERAGVERLCR